MRPERGALRLSFIPEVDDVKTAHKRNLLVDEATWSTSPTVLATLDAGALCGVERRVRERKLLHMVPYSG